MKKLLTAVLFTLCCALPALADMNNDFKDHFHGQGLAAYNRDLSSMIGLADFHTAKGVTFPGFDIGASVAAVKTSSENFSGKSYFYAPFLSAETQLPVFNIAVAARGTSYDGFKSVGGGIKWHDSLTAVKLAASVFYDHYNADYYDGDHYSASASASVNILVFTPYVGIGYDYSTLKVKDLSSYSGKKTDDGVVRYTAGVNFHPLPLFYVYGAYTYTKYNHGFQGGVGLNF